MAGTKVSFDDIIQAGRRKRNEELAQQMLGSGRRKTAPAAINNDRQTRKTGDLASRVGVSRRNNTNRRNDRGPIRATAADNNNNNNNNNNTVFPSRLAPQPSTNRHRGRRAATRQSGINIRGLAGGLHVITASNFAPGTTAKDIERALQGSGHGASLRSCRITTASPTVMADLAYSNAGDADKVINDFNQKPADGRILHVYYKDNSVASPQVAQPPVPTSQPVAASQPIVAPQPMHEDYTMQVDDTASQREAENRMREDRRGAGARDRREVVAAGSRDRRGYYEDWEGAGPGPRYNDSRSAFGEDARQPRSYGRRYNRGA